MARSEPLDVIGVEEDQNIGNSSFKQTRLAECLMSGMYFVSRGAAGFPAVRRARYFQRGAGRLCGDLPGDGRVPGSAAT